MTLLLMRFVKEADAVEVSDCSNQLNNALYWTPFIQSSFDFCCVVHSHPNIPVIVQTKVCAHMHDSPDTPVSFNQIVTWLREGGITGLPKDSRDHVKFYINGQQLQISFNTQLDLMPYFCDAKENALTYNTQCEIASCTDSSKYAVNTAKNACCETATHAATYDERCKVVSCTDPSRYTISENEDACCQNLDNVKTYNTQCKVVSCIDPNRHVISVDSDACCERIANVDTYDGQCKVVSCIDPDRHVISVDSDACCEPIANVDTYDDQCKVVSCIDPSIHTISVNRDACCKTATHAATYDEQCKVLSCTDSSRYTISENRDACCENIAGAAMFGSQCEIVRCDNPTDYVPNAPGNLCCKKIADAAAYNAQCEVQECADPNAYTISENRDACCNNLDNVDAYNDQCKVVSCIDSSRYTISKHRDACCRNVENVYAYDDQCKVVSCIDPNRHVISVDSDACCERIANVDTYDGQCKVVSCIDPDRHVISVDSDACCEPIANVDTYDDQCKVVSCIDPSIHTISVNRDACCKTATHAATYDEQCKVLSCTDSSRYTISENRDACCENIAGAAMFGSQCEIVRCDNPTDYVPNAPGNLCCKKIADAAAYNAQCEVQECADPNAYTISENRDACCNNLDNVDAYNDQCKVVSCIDPIRHVISVDSDACCEPIANAATYDDQCKVVSCVPAQLFSRNYHRTACCFPSDVLCYKIALQTAAGIIYVNPPNDVNSCVETRATQELLPSLLQAVNLYDPFHYEECCAAELEASEKGNVIACRALLVRCESESELCGSWLNACVEPYLRCLEQAAFEERTVARQCSWAQTMVKMVDGRAHKLEIIQLPLQCAAAVKAMINGQMDFGTECSDTDEAVASICVQSTAPATVGRVQPESSPLATAPRPAGLYALVVRGDQCETCERAYYDGSCACPSQTRATELRGFHGEMVYTQRDDDCYKGGFSFLFCVTEEVTTNTSDPRSVSFFAGLPAVSGSTGGIERRLEDWQQVTLTRCTHPHAATGECKCPAQMHPRPFLLPHPDAAGLDVHLVVFCAPWQTTVHILNTETGACINPLGVNMSCECAVSGPSVAVPIAYVNSTSRLLMSGLLRFCSAVQSDVVREGASIAVVGVVAALGGASMSSAVQGSIALSTASCGEGGGSRSSSRQGALVPFSVGSDRLTSGLNTLWILVAALLTLQSIVVACVWLGRRLCGTKGERLCVSAGLVRFPAAAVTGSLLAVQGGVIETMQLFVEGHHFVHYAVGVLSMMGVIGSGLGLLCMGRRLPVKLHGLCKFARYGAARCDCVPLWVRRILPSGYFDSVEPLWRMWGFVYGASLEGMQGWDPSEGFVLSLIIGISTTLSATSLVACRVLGTVSALACLATIAGYIKWPLHRRPTNTLGKGVMHAVNAGLAVRSTWFRQAVDDAPFTYTIMVVACLLTVLNCVWFFVEWRWKRDMAGTVAKNDSVTHNSSEEEKRAKTCRATQYCLEVNDEHMFDFSFSAGSRAAFDGLLGDLEDAMCRRSLRSVIHDFHNSNSPKESSIASPIDFNIAEIFRDSVSIESQLPGTLMTGMFDEPSDSDTESALASDQ